MPIIKIQNKLSGDNKNSSKNSISYLEKEQKFRDKSLRKEEYFFNQKGVDFSAEEAVKKLDSNRRGLGKNDAKYYSLIISPSKKELRNLSDIDLKNYANNVMSLYANQFNRNVNSDELVWFGKLEHKRRYKGYFNGNSDKLPPGKKSGDFKPGDQRHLHILVRRKTEKNMKLSPLTKARSQKSNLTNTRIGFDRVDFFQKCDELMIQKLKNINPAIEINNDDIFALRYIKSKGYNSRSIENAKKIGIHKHFIDYAISIYQELANKKRVKTQNKPILDTQKPKGRINLSSAEKVKIAILFHSQERYLGKIKNISFNSKPLNAALVKKFNFELTKTEITEVHQKLRGLKKGKGRRI